MDEDIDYCKDSDNVIKLEEKVSDAVKISDKTEENIEKRINELNCEWSAEKVIITAGASGILLSSVLGYSINKKWIGLSAALAGLLLSDALSSENTLIPIAKGFGLREASIIQQEKESLELLKP